SAWLCQANHIFGRLGINSNLQNYVLLDSVDFVLHLKPCANIAPRNLSGEGYLFLCPLADFQIYPGVLKWPQCPAYWATDPDGAEQLSTELAAELGLPAIEVSTELRARSWNDSAYAGLREFYQEKGFDPDSQDLARYLRQPLYQLSVNTQSRIVEECDADDPGGECKHAISEDAESD
ncbi:hypothetical protein R3P38DRAFT_3602152, partial [Favolaschia claudopus]